MKARILAFLLVCFSSAAIAAPPKCAELTTTKLGPKERIEKAINGGATEEYISNKTDGGPFRLEGSQIELPEALLLDASLVAMSENQFKGWLNEKFAYIDGVKANISKAVFRTTTQNFDPTLTKKSEYIKRILDGFNEPANSENFSNARAALKPVLAALGANEANTVVVRTSVRFQTSTGEHAETYDFFNFSFVNRKTGKVVTMSTRAPMPVEHFKNQAKGSRAEFVANGKVLDPVEDHFEAQDAFRGVDEVCYKGTAEKALARMVSILKNGGFNWDEEYLEKPRLSGKTLTVTYMDGPNDSPTKVSIKPCK